MPNYAVFNIKKPAGGLNSIAKHIERTHHPDNARAELTHLNRYDIIKYPPGVKTIAEAVEHRIATAGISRKVGKNQVRCLNVLMTSDHDAMERIQKEGKFEGWLNDSIKWVQKKFGKENVVAAVLHMDEYTPHLHVIVVPIVTTERVRKQRESKATRTYRTKPKNRPRLCADDVVTRKNLDSCHDEYALVMAKYGLQRGIKGSDARHVDQHQYYRDCQRNKAELEQQVSELSAEKEKVSKEAKAAENAKAKAELATKALESRKSIIEDYNSKKLDENAALTDRTRELLDMCDTLQPMVDSLKEEQKQLQQSKERLTNEIATLERRKSNNEQNADLVKYKADIERYLPDVEDLLSWGRYCSQIGFPDPFVHRILNFEDVEFKGALYSKEHNQKFRTDFSVAKLERDPKEKHIFDLKIDGVNVFQWFRDMARKLLEKIGFKQSQPKQNRGAHV